MGTVTVAMDDDMFRRFVRWTERTKLSVRPLPGAEHAYTLSTGDTKTPPTPRENGARWCR